MVNLISLIDDHFVDWKRKVFVGIAVRGSLQRKQISHHFIGIYLCLLRTFETAAILKNCQQEQPTWEYLLFQISGSGARLICKVDIFMLLVLFDNWKKIGDPAVWKQNLALWRLNCFSGNSANFFILRLKITFKINWRMIAIYEYMLSIIFRQSLLGSSDRHTQCIYYPT